MPRRSLVVLIAGAAVLLAGAAAWWVQRPPAVPALVLQPAPLVRSLLFAARVAALQRVELGATVTGRIASVAVAEGATVRQGALLLQLEDSEWRAALDQARASAEQAAARLAGLQGTGRSAAQAGVAQAESTLLAAQAELRRTRALLDQGFISPARLDEAQRAVAVAQAQRDGAAAQRAALADAGADVAQARATLAQAQAAVAAAQARLAQAGVHAPADGRVLQRLAEPGQIVQPGRALLVLALEGPAQLVAQVDERFLAELQPGQPASVVADAYPGQRFAAQVLRIAPLVDAQRGAVEVRLAVPAPVPAFLREDMTLSVAVETGRRAQALVVPTAALRPGGAAPDQAQVLLAMDGHAVLRSVRLGLRTLDGAEATDGLAAGDVLLLDASLAPGSRVHADTTPAASARPAAGGARSADGSSGISNAMGR